MAKQKKREWLSILKLVIIALLVALFVRTSLFSPIIVDGPSTRPPLYSKVQMTVDQSASRFKDPERFVIVVFHAYEQKDFIKRDIGLHGAHVMVKDDVLYVNGKPLE